MRMNGDQEGRARKIGCCSVRLGSARCCGLVMRGVSGSGGISPPVIKRKLTGNLLDRS